MIVSTEINAIRLGSAGVSSMYLGNSQVWPPLPASGVLWYNFSRNSCVTMTLLSSTGIANGILWGDGSVSGISSGLVTYREAFGTGQC